MGSSSRLLELLADPPADDYALLELAPEWDDLAGAAAQLAAAVRLFVITRDPLDWIPDRGAESATVNADGETLELAVYVARAALEEELGDVERVAARLARIAAHVLSTAIELQGIVLSGGYPALAARAEAPPLVSDDARPPTVALPRIAVLDGWEPLGLGAIQDLVQEAFGPVDFDRSRVRLAPGVTPTAGCRACAGQSFGFPAGLHDAAPGMCDAHREAAHCISQQRMERARRSNGPGWRAIAKASARTSGLPEPPRHPLPPQRSGHPGRNDPCPCGSGRKYKHCCGAA